MGFVNCIAQDTNQFLKLSGGTMSGDLTLNGNAPTTDNMSVPKKYVDQTSMPFNLIIGGDFSNNPWQRGTSFTSVATNTYTADRWQHQKTGTGICDISQAADAPTAAQAGYLSSHSLLVTVTTADASIAATDQYIIRQPIEGYNFSTIAQNPFVVSFWVKSSLTGIYCIAMRNSANDRSYVAEYTISSANTWQYVSIPVLSSPSGGTWNYVNGKGIDVVFSLAIGSNFNTTQGAWQTGNFLSTSNQVNFFGTNGNTFQIDLVQVQGGSYATGFQKRTAMQELQLCMRYYEKTYTQGVNPATNSAVGSYNISNSAAVAGALDSGLRFKVPKRSAPTMTLYSVAGTTARVTQDDASEVVAAAANIGDSGFRCTATNGASRYGQAGHFQAVAEL